MRLYRAFTLLTSLAVSGCGPSFTLDVLGSAIKGFKYPNTTNNPLVHTGGVVAILTHPYTIVPVCQPSDFGGSVAATSSPVDIVSDKETKLKLNITATIQQALQAAVGAGYTNSEVTNLKAVTNASDWAKNGPLALASDACKKQMDFVNKQYKPMIKNQGDIAFEFIDEAAVATYEYSVKTTGNGEVSAELTKALSSLGALGGKIDASQTNTLSVKGAEQVISFNTRPLNR